MSSQSESNLLDDRNPGLWPEETVWTLFCEILQRDCPLPDMARSLEPYRKIFRSSYEKIIREHENCHFWYSRTESGQGQLNPLNLEHLTRLLHVFMSRLYAIEAPTALMDCLFLTMRCRCGLHLFYRSEEIDYFFALHPVGSVVGYGDFGPVIIVSQNCTIGKNNDAYPTVEGGLAMGPGSMILGNCRIGKNVRLGANSAIIDKDVPADTLVFGQGPDLVFKDNFQDNRRLVLDGGFPDMDSSSPLGVAPAC